MRYDQSTWDEWCGWCLLVAAGQCVGGPLRYLWLTYISCVGCWRHTRLLKTVAHSNCCFWSVIQLYLLAYYLFLMCHSSRRTSRWAIYHGHRELSTNVKWTLILTSLWRYSMLFSFFVADTLNIGPFLNRRMLSCSVYVHKWGWVCTQSTVMTLALGGKEGSEKAYRLHTGQWWQFGMAP